MFQLAIQTNTHMEMSFSKRVCTSPRSAETQCELKNCAKGPQKSSILEPSVKDLGKLFPATFPLL